METKLFNILYTVALALVFAVSPAWAEAEKTYLSLLLEESNDPYGHIIVQVPENRKAPKEWKMEWFVSTYTPKGYRVFLGMIDDTEPLSEESKFALKVPVGDCRIEITKKSKDRNTGASGAYNISTGKWVPPDYDPVYVADKVISVKAGQVKVVELTYQNPKVFSEPEKEGKKKTLYVWENFGLLIKDGSNKDLPGQAPKVYPLVQYAPFAELGVQHLVAALKKNSMSPAAGALLRIDQMPESLLIAGLKDNSLKLNGLEARIISKCGKQGVIDPLLKRLEGEYEQERYFAAWILGELKASAAVWQLTKALKDESVMVRNHAAYALAKLRNNNAVDALIEASSDKGCGKFSLFITTETEMCYVSLVNRNGICGDHLPIPSYCVRENAIYALAQIGDARALETLIGLLNDVDGKIRTGAVMALGNINDGRSVDALISKLENEKLSQVRYIAVTALGRIGDAKALKSLEELSLNDPNEHVRKAAKNALEKIDKAGQ